MSKRNSVNTKKQVSKAKAVEIEAEEVPTALVGKNAIFHIEGGVGKHVAASAVIASYKKAKPKNNIIVVCAWPEVFLNNPHVDRVYRIGNTPHFYKDYILNKDVEIHSQEPYKTTDHITKKKHLIDSWCDLINVPRAGTAPELVLNFREKEEAGRLIQNPTNKPVLLLQPFGGPGKEHQETPYSWTRDIHPTVVQNIVNALHDRYHIVHVCYDLHPQLENVQRIDAGLPKKVLFGLLLYSTKRLLIDSSLQHAAAAMNLPSTVVWVATQPETFGYDLHTNIKPSQEFLEGTVDSYLYDYSFTGALHECQYENPSQIFDANKIANSLV